MSTTRTKIDIQSCLNDCLTGGQFKNRRAVVPETVTQRDLHEGLLPASSRSHFSSGRSTTRKIKTVV